MEKILDIAQAIANEKGLDYDRVLVALKDAFVRSAKKVIDHKCIFEAAVNSDTKSFDLFQIITVVADDDIRLKESLSEFMAISEAKKYDEQVELDDQLQISHSLEDYGRTAASILHKEIEYGIQKLVEDEIYNKYKSKIGTLVNGRVTRVDSKNSTYIEVDEIKAILPMKNRIKGESFKSGDFLKAVVRKVDIDKDSGIQIELSRTTPKFLEELLALEVPEIADGAVIIQKSARIPGERAKVALLSTHPQVDAVGATVGVKGVRINAVSQELIGESIDCIEYSSIPELFISRIMSPAIISSVDIKTLEDGVTQKAIVTLPADQKSKAIGKNGINIRLASMLSGMEIELVENDVLVPKKDELKETKDSVDALRALFN